MFSRVCACVRVRAYIQKTLHIGRLRGYGLQVAQTEAKDMLEKDTVKAILKYLKTVPNCFSWKEHGGMYGTAGIPDIICCYCGIFVAFEVKTETGKLTKLQEATIRKIKEAKGQAFKVTSVEEVKQILEHMEVQS